MSVKIDFYNTSKRIPLCFCIDSSRSMEVVVEGQEFCKETGKTFFEDDDNFIEILPTIPGDPRVKEYKDIIRAGMKNFYEAISSNTSANAACDCCLVSFADNPTVLKEFGGFEGFDNVHFPDPCGNSNLSAALNHCLAQIDTRISEYANRVSYHRPWIILFTDGKYTDEITFVQRELLKRQSEKRIGVLIMSMSNNDKDKERLAELSFGKILDARNPNIIKKMFNSLANSVSSIASKGQDIDFIEAFEKESNSVNSLFDF